jgi:hypothetical protein
VPSAFSPIEPASSFPRMPGTSWSRPWIGRRGRTRNSRRSSRVARTPRASRRRGAIRVGRLRLRFATSWMAPRGSETEGRYLQGFLRRQPSTRTEDRPPRRRFGHSRADLSGQFPGGRWGGAGDFAGRFRRRLLSSAQEVTRKPLICRVSVADASCVRCKVAVAPSPWDLAFCCGLWQGPAAGRNRGYAWICADMRGIRALKRVSAQIVGGGLNHEPVNLSQHVYIGHMARTNDETPSERAEHLLADRTGFQLPPDAWDELVAIMDREAKSNPKLARLLSRRSAA